MYSRQELIHDPDSIQSFAQKRLLIVHADPVASEVTKNLVLAGCKQFDACDDGIVKKEDAQLSYFLHGRVGQKRRDVLEKEMKKLNTDIKFEHIPFHKAIDNIQRYDAVLYTFSSNEWRRLVHVVEACNISKVPMVLTQNVGMVSRLYVDCGKVTVEDATGSPPESYPIKWISNEVKGVIQLDCDEVPRVQGETIVINGVEGMNEINGTNVVVCEQFHPFQIPIGDSSGFGKYEHGGRVSIIKTKREVCNVPILHALDSPQKSKQCEDYSSPAPATEIHKFLNFALGHSDTWTPNHRVLQAASWASPPSISCIGGIAAQEILKLYSKKFLPLSGWWTLCGSVPEGGSEAKLFKALGSKPVTCFQTTMTSARRIFHSLQKRNADKLSKLSAIVVGAGATGCEVIKNLAACSFGRIHIYDMDHIEDSNRSRQFLYRLENIGQSKALTAAKMIRKRYPTVDVVPHNVEINEETLTDEMLSTIDLVVMAVDTVDTRMFLSAKCVRNNVAYMDVGLNGLQGNYDWYEPHKTLTYHCIPPEREVIPKMTCTIKSFPYNTAHLIHYAKEKFLQCFVGTTTIETSQHFESHNIKNIHQDCLVWAVQLWHQLFVQEVEELLALHPDDSSWTGKRLRPTPLSFDLCNADVLNFVRLATCLRLRCFGANDNVTDQDILDNKRYSKSSKGVNWVSEINMQESRAIEMKGLVFEKDDDANGHIAFILAAANNRATNYGLPKTTWLETKRIAGNIAPSICTTASTICGLACLDINRLAIPTAERGKPTRGDMNLAGPYFEKTFQCSPDKIKFCNTTFTAWDSIRLSSQNVHTVKDVVKWVETKYSLSIAILLLGNRIVFDSDDETEEIILLHELVKPAKGMRSGKLVFDGSAILSTDELVGLQPIPPVVVDVSTPSQILETYIRRDRLSMWWASMNILPATLKRIGSLTRHRVLNHVFRQ